MEPTASKLIVLTSLKQKVGFLATLQHSLDSARVFLQLTQKVYKKDFERRLRKGLEKIWTDDNIFPDVSDDVTKTSMMGHALERPCRVSEQDQHTVIIQLRDLVQKVTADRVVLAAWSADVLLIPPAIVSAVGI